jgi:hypothetical protein
MLHFGQFMFVCDVLIHLKMDATLDHCWRKDNEIVIQASQENMIF